MESCISDCEDCDRNCDRSRAWYFSATGDWYWSDRNDVCAGIESNCTNSGVCARNQFDCKCGERKWQAVPYDYIYVYFKYDACSGGRCECELLFPVTMTLDIESYQSEVVPSGIVEVLQNILMNITDNPLRAMLDANYICILAWAVLFGLAMRSAGKGVKASLVSISDAVSRVVRWIIGCAPFGIMGLVFTTVSEWTFDIQRIWKAVIGVGWSDVNGCTYCRSVAGQSVPEENAYPLAFRCLRESGVTAFFTRSSAANIPVNMSLCKRLGLDPDIYSVSIPLGATINMDGAAITITIMALSVANTMGVAVDIPTAFMLSLMATLGACGASGVAGGSLLLIPMACSLFGIPQDISMQAVAVGMIIGVVQDSLETAINSSGDVLFAATAEYCQWQKEGKQFKIGAIVNPDEN